MVRWVPTGDKRVEYTTHGDQMAEWRSVVTAQFPEYRSQINILRTTTSPAQAVQFLQNHDKQTLLMINIKYIEFPIIFCDVRHPSSVRKLEEINLMGALKELHLNESLVL